jgi:hypothetical protein
MEHSFCDRKFHATQNIMGVIGFDLRFTYVLTDWEGTAHDALVLRDALEHENGLRVPQGKILHQFLTKILHKFVHVQEHDLLFPHMLGKFYLGGVGYGAKPGFLPPFRVVRYHLNEGEGGVGVNPVQNEKELFNLRHSSLRVILERAFGSLKRRFKILDDATPFFPFSTK